jgi:hypothetical protein
MFLFFRDAYRLLKTGDVTTSCNHDWVEKDFRRHCSKCDAHQMLIENRYPDVGQPRYEWQ